MNTTIAPRNPRTTGTVRHTRRRSAALASLALAAGLLGSACSTSGSGPEAIDRPAPTSATTAESTTSSTDSTAPGAEVPELADEAFVIRSRHDLVVHDQPSADSATRTLPATTEFGSELALLVTGQQPGWAQVLLPGRPTGARGWVNTSSETDIELRSVTTRLEVDLGARTLALVDAGKVLLTTPVAIGAPESPTPTGFFSVTDKLQDPNPNGAYGPFALGLSGRSEVLTDFAGGDGQIGIHGTNDPSSIGQDVSHGCIRVPNDVITQLNALLPSAPPSWFARASDEGRSSCGSSNGHHSRGIPGGGGESRRHPGLRRTVRHLVRPGTRPLPPHRPRSRHGRRGRPGQLPRRLDPPRHAGRPRCLRWLASAHRPQQVAQPPGQGAAQRRTGRPDHDHHDRHGRPRSRPPGRHGPGGTCRPGVGCRRRPGRTRHEHPRPAPAPRAGGRRAGRRAGYHPQQRPSDAVHAAQAARHQRQGAGVVAGRTPCLREPPSDPGRRRHRHLRQAGGEGDRPPRRRVRRVLTRALRARLAGRSVRGRAGGRGTVPAEGAGGVGPRGGRRAHGRLHGTGRRHRSRGGTNPCGPRRRCHLCRWSRGWSGRRGYGYRGDTARRRARRRGATGRPRTRAGLHPPPRAGRGRCPGAAGRGGRGAQRGGRRIDRRRRGGHRRRPHLRSRRSLIRPGHQHVRRIQFRHHTLDRCRRVRRGGRRPTRIGSDRPSGLGPAGHFTTGERPAGTNPPGTTPPGTSPPTTAPQPTDPPRTVPPTTTPPPTTAPAAPPKIVRFTATNSGKQCRGGIDWTVSWVTENADSVLVGPLQGPMQESLSSGLLVICHPGAATAPQFLLVAVGPAGQDQQIVTGQ